jgi:hypothetical protein
MEAVVYRGARTLEIESQTAEAPGRGQVAIELACTGICGTDLHIYHGDMDDRVGPRAAGSSWWPSTHNPARSTCTGSSSASWNCSAPASTSATTSLKRSG